MKTGKWAGIALCAVALLTAGGLAFADGLIKSPELLEKIRIGVTTSQQVTEILGPPARIEKFARRNVEAWDYRVQGWGTDSSISIEIDSKGIVSNVQRIVRWGL
jgi:outer membrane protein assembly factor BamE (lipoprotein component of BamABCDE complex)